MWAAAGCTFLGHGLVVTSRVGLTSGVALQALNRVLAHARLQHAPRFSAPMVHQAEAFNSRYGLREPADVEHGLGQLRSRMQQPDKDLQALMDEFWPSMGFQGLAKER